MPCRARHRDIGDMFDMCMSGCDSTLHVLSSLNAPHASFDSHKAACWIERAGMQVVFHDLVKTKCESVLGKVFS